MHIGLGLGGSSLDAKGGIVGGTIELNKINTYGKYCADYYFPFDCNLYFSYCLNSTYQRRSRIRASSHGWS